MEFFDADDKIVVVERARARDAGAVSSWTSPMASLWTVQDATLVRHEVYLNPDDALKAAGLDGKPHG